MSKKVLVKGLVASFIALLIISIVSFVFDFYFKIAISLFLVNFALLFSFKINSLFNESQKKSETNSVKEPFFTANLLKNSFKLLIVYGIPLLILGYILYFNFLPFGFEKTYVIDVGAMGDTSPIKEFYLKNNYAISEPFERNETGYRRIDGSTNLVFKPRLQLTNSTAIIEIIGDGNIFLINLANKDFEKNSLDLNIDFSKGIPPQLEGEVNIKNGCAEFNGSEMLKYLESQDIFEKGPFAVYVEWSPEEENKDFQQLIGHYNWEISQNKNGVMFQIKSNDEKGNFYSIKHPIKLDFFHKPHSLLAIYKPDEVKGGYIELFVDGEFSSTKQINKNTINPNYNNNLELLSIGKNSHVLGEYFKGCIYKSLIINDIDKVLNNKKESFKFNNILYIPIKGKGNIDQIKLEVIKN